MLLLWAMRKGLTTDMACDMHACFGVGGVEVDYVIFITGMLVGITLYIIGSLMEHHERAKREREWRDRRK